MIKRVGAFWVERAASPPPTELTGKLPVRTGQWPVPPKRSRWRCAPLVKQGRCPARPDAVKPFLISGNEVFGATPKTTRRRRVLPKTVLPTSCRQNHFPRAQRLAPQALVLTSPVFPVALENLPPSTRVNFPTAQTSPTARASHPAKNLPPRPRVSHPPAPATARR